MIVIKNLAEAKEQIHLLLKAAGGDPDIVFRALNAAQRNASRIERNPACTVPLDRAALGLYSEEESEQYNLMRVALADITGDAGYRS